MAKIQLTDTHGVKTLFRWLHQTKKSIWHQVAGESFLFAWIKLNSLNHMLLFSSGSQTSNILMEKQIFLKSATWARPCATYVFVPSSPAQSGSGDSQSWLRKLRLGEFEWLKLIQLWEIKNSFSTPFPFYSPHAVLFQVLTTCLLIQFIPDCSLLSLLLPPSPSPPVTWAIASASSSR